MADTRGARYLGEMLAVVKGLGYGDVAEELQKRLERTPIVDSACGLCGCEDPPGYRLINISGNDDDPVHIRLCRSDVKDDNDCYLRWLRGERPQITLEADPAPIYGVLPRGALALLGLQPGDVLDVEYTPDGRLILSRAESASSGSARR